MKLPATVYVAPKESGEDEYLSCERSAGDLMENDGPLTIGVYQLVETIVATKRLETAPAKPVKPARKRA